MRTAVKITLNSADEFDAVILDYLKNKRKAAAHCKRLLYDTIIRMQDVTPSQAVPAPGERAGTEKIGTVEPEQKVSLDKLLKF